MRRLENFKKEAAIIVLSIALSVAVTVMVGAYSEDVQSSIAENIIRLHVIANSDTDYDQSLKLKVRDAVMEEVEYITKNCSNVEQGREAIEKELENITKTANEAIKLNGYNYSVKAFVGKSAFPMKSYGNVTLPAGIYDALKIEIGEAKGKNWWCVVYPPLCLMESGYENVNEEGMEKLSGVLDDEELSIITAESEEAEIKFKIVEWWQERNLDDNMESVLSKQK